MSARYAPLPNPHTDPEAIDEMEAAFDDSDDDEDDRAPLTSRNGYHSLPNAEPLPHGRDHEDFGRSGAQAPAPAAYDFENTDYDYIRPPPGSPPGPSSRALPNEFGNSNGLVPSFNDVPTDASSTSRSGNWFRSTAVSRKGTANPAAYTARRRMPRASVPLAAASTNTAERMGPIQGVQPKAKANPSKKPLTIPGLVS